VKTDIDQNTELVI